jgi:hypothetical protein
MDTEPTATTITAATRRARRRRAAFPGARRRRAASIIAVFAGLALFAAACGGGGSQDGPGSAHPSKSASAQGAGGTGPVAFAQCMRSHGVSSFPDPQNGHFLISGSVQNNPNFHGAVQACQHMLGPNGASNGGGSHNSQLLAFAHCMQTHGVPQFPDPTANGAIGIPQGVDPNSATFQNAWHKCQSNLPGNLRGQQP